MDRIDSIGRILEDLARMLDDPRLDPDVSRTDWDTHRPTIASLRGLVQARLFEDFAALLDGDEAAGKDVEPTRVNVALLVAEAAALLHASGGAFEAREMLSLAARLAPRSGGARDELDAASGDLDGFTRLVRARWLLRQRREREADALLKKLTSQASDARLRKRAQEQLDAPRPMQGDAPTMFYLNGFGFGLYGQRDPWPDGSYVATYCAAALYVPVLPVRAYRVRPHPNGGWVFLAREKLSRFARGVQVAALGALLFGGAALGYNSWQDSPGHRADVAVEAAQREEQRHHDAAALQGYEQALQTYAGTSTSSSLHTAAMGVVRLAVKGFHEPAKAADVEQIQRIVRHYESLPQAVKFPETSRAMTGHVRRWMGQVGESSPAAALASLRLAAVGERVAAPEERSAFQERTRALHRRVAEHYGTDWPLEALPHHVAGGPTSPGAAAVVEALLASPSLTLAAEQDLLAWSAAVNPPHRQNDDPSLAALLRRVPESLRAASVRVEDEARKRALEGGDRTALEAVAREHPEDQEVVALLAAQRRQEGGAQEALRTLAALGTPGRMTPLARVRYAQTLADAGRLDEAVEVLSRTVEARLPRYQEALREATAAFDQEQRRLVDGARAGHIPQDLSDRLRNQSDDAQQRIFREWLGEQLRSDPGLSARRAAVERFSDVVPVALTLGMFQLRRSNELDGEARAQALADAERLFLAIREQAEGSPEYRLGLGQVYHRLGRATEGDRELDALVREGSAEQKLAVADVYRDLGVTARARDVARDVFEHATGAERDGAAAMLSLTAETLDEEAEWLGRVSADAPHMTARRREVEARRLLRDGRLDEADRAFADAAAAYLRTPSTSGASANNAALSESARFQCTGDLARVQAAVRSLETARRRTPDSAIVAQNLAAVLMYQGRLRVLEGFVRVSVLKPASGEVDRILGALDNGPQREAVRAALRRDPSIQRGLELFREAAVLAPESTYPYSAEQGFLDLIDDVDGLRALKARLARVARLDTSAYTAWFRRWESGSDDVRSRRESDANLQRVRRVVTDAERARHPATLAAALLLQGNALGDRTWLTESADDARQAADALRRVTGAWPDLGASGALARMLLHGAVIESLAASPTLATAWREDRRTWGLEFTLRRLRATGAEGERAIATLHARPETAEALALLRVSAATHPTLSDRVLGLALGDEALMNATRAVLSREDARLRAELDVRLEPSAFARECLALFDP